MVQSKVEDVSTIVTRYNCNGENESNEFQNEKIKKLIKQELTYFVFQFSIISVNDICDIRTYPFALPIVVVVAI